jgi:hypothetical protein
VYRVEGLAKASDQKQTDTYRSSWHCPFNISWESVPWRRPGQGIWSKADRHIQSFLTLSL